MTHPPGPSVPLTAPLTRVRLTFSIELPYQVLGPGADYLCTIQPARTRHQQVLTESLDVGPATAAQEVDPTTGTRLLRLRAPPGPLTLRSRGTVEIAQWWTPAHLLQETPVAHLPTAVLPYLYPSRYCPSDRLGQVARQEFGHLAPGYGRVLAIQAWVRQRVRFLANSSTAHTGALETLADGVGVCRDFAHLFIALCRALNLPARFTTGIDYGADPALGPTDFHAYVEVWLGDRWYIVDPSGTAIPMGFLRFATGRDAADVAFATIFGPVQSFRPVLSIRTVPGGDGQVTEPRHRPEALSTDGP